MNKISTIHTVINRLSSSSIDENLLNGLKESKPAAFSRLYDQYASILLGVITKIIDDKDEAVTLLETTFKKAHNQISEFQAKKQPLFVWLLEIARCTALDALKKRKAAKPLAPQLTTSGQVIVSPAQSSYTTILVETAVKLSDPQLKELLDKVLFKNCTPEEAAASLGIPVASARQQLRLAMQQVRAS